MAVRVIRARNTDPVVTMPTQVTKAAAYCRVSTDSEEQESSYEAQVTHYTNFIQAHDGWELAGIFADEGLSGTQAKTRPQFNAMIEACENGDVNLVITKSISRFARNTLDGQQDRLEVLASQVPEEEKPMNTTVVDEVGSTQVITSELDEAAFLRSQIVEIRRRKDGLYAERAEHANTEVQIRLLLELVDEMVKNSLPEWMARGAQPEGEETGACRDYDDFFSRTRYTVPEGVLDVNGRMEVFNNDLVIRYLDRVVVKDDGYEVTFKAGVTVEVEV